MTNNDDEQISNAILDELLAWLSEVNDLSQGVMDSIEDLENKLKELENVSEKWNEVVYGD